MKFLALFVLHLLVVDCDWVLENRKPKRHLVINTNESVSHEEEEHSPSTTEELENWESIDLTESEDGSGTSDEMDVPKIKEESSSSKWGIEVICMIAKAIFAAVVRIFYAIWWSFRGENEPYNIL